MKQQYPSSAPESPTTHPRLHRRGGTVLRLLTYLLVPMACASAAWITAGRALLGAGGELVPIYAISFGPALLGILLVAALFSYREMKLQEAGRQAGLPPVTALVAASTWILAGFFGLVAPDRLDGRNISAAAALLGPDVIGLSAAFGNTSGILTFSFAIATLLLAISDYRRARALTQGLDDTTREQLEREESMYDFLD
ncbi:hypothetical protein [Rothia nasimurium]|uniref:hypothetical protein n=1 Tax=Rothia nasimurium TaxID=85336 RepID=UPI001F482BEA|nr:hypothetical protein [Rothia nasimurium]